MKKFFDLYNATKTQVVEAVKVYLKSRGGQVMCDESKTITVNDESEQDSEGNPMPMILRVKGMGIDSEGNVIVSLDDMGREWNEDLSGFSIDTIFEFTDTIMDLSPLGKLEKEGWDLTYRMQSVIADIVDKHGGFINLLEIRKKNDSITPIYAYVLDENKDKYRECIVNYIKVENDDEQRYLCIRVEFEDKSMCDVRNDETWYDMLGGLVLGLPTMYSICSYLPEYVDC